MIKTEIASSKHSGAAAPYVRSQISQCQQWHTTALNTLLNNVYSLIGHGT